MYRIYVMHPETLQTELVDTTSNESSALVVVSVLTKSLGEDLQVFYTEALEDEFINYKNREYERH